MTSTKMKDLIDAGLHFGHETRRWNPKMKPYLYTQSNGIHIIDLRQTVGLLEEALVFVREAVADGGRFSSSVPRNRPVTALPSTPRRLACHM